MCFILMDVSLAVGNSHKKNAAMLDSDDTDSVSSSSTVRSDHVLVSGFEEVELDKETVLDQCVDALYEKRYMASYVNYIFQVKLKYL